MGFIPSGSTSSAGMSAGAGAGAGGFGGTMKNLLSNNLFLSMLSGAGQAISEGKPIASGLNPLIQQNIGAQSKAKLNSKYIQMLSQMLKGGAKVNMDKDKFSVSGPSTIFGSDGDQSGGGGGGDAGQSQNGMLEMLNPSSSSPDISSADLAGLTSKDVSEALSGASDVQYKQGMLDYYKDQMSLERDKFNTPAPPKETADILNYKFAQSQGYDKDFETFTKDSQTTHKKDYDEAVKGGYSGSFNNWMLEMARAGAINLGEVAPRAEQASLGKQKADIQSPDFPTSVQNDLMKDAAAWFDPEGLDDIAKRYQITDEEAKAAIQKAMVIEEMDKRVNQAYKGNVERRPNGWYVDGKLKVRNPYAK